MPEGTTIKFRSEDSLARFIVELTKARSTAIFHVEETATGYMLTFTGGY